MFFVNVEYVFCGIINIFWGLIFEVFMCIFNFRINIIEWVINFSVGLLYIEENLWNYIFMKNYKIDNLWKMVFINLIDFIDIVYFYFIF